MRQATKLILIAMVAAACSTTPGEDTTTIASVDDVPSTTTSTTIASTTTTTTSSVPESTTTTLSEDAFKGIAQSFVDGEVPDTSGNDFGQILADLLAYLGYLFENPGTDDLITAIIAPGSDYAEFLIERYEGRVESGGRTLPGGRGEIRRASLESLQDDGNTAIVLAVSDFDGATIVDSQGQIIEEQPDRSPNIILFNLVRADNGDWRISDARDLGDASGEEE